MPATDNADIKLPTGIQLVGRVYDDVTVLKAAAAWGKAFDWKKLSNLSRHSVELLPFPRTSHSLFHWRRLKVIDNDQFVLSK